MVMGITKIRFLVMKIAKLRFLVMGITYIKIPGDDNPQIPILPGDGDPSCLPHVRTHPPVTPLPAPLPGDRWHAVWPRDPLHLCPRAVHQGRL